MPAAQLVEAYNHHAQRMTGTGHAAYSSTVSTGTSTAEPQLYYIHTDHLGTPQELTDQQGQLQWTGHYRAWGELFKANDSDGNAASVEMPLRFQGQYCDAETGLHYNPHRYYDPQLGWFTIQDPISLAGGVNLYQYAPNPVQWVDPLGLTSCPMSRSEILINRNSARKLLKSRGLNKKIQHETVDSFDGEIYATRAKKGEVFTITEDMPGSASQVYVTRGSAGSTAAERRANLALPPNNSATHEGIVSLTRDQVLLEGKVAPQLQWGHDKVGGGWQVVTAGGKYSGATEPL